MGIALARVDDRLIHGQVVHGWVAFLGITWIVVADDQAAGDSLKWTLYRMAVPERIRLDIMSVSNAARHMAEHMNNPEVACILFSEPSSVLAYLNAGGPISSLNVGGVRHGGKRLKIGSAIFLDDEDMDILKQINEMGIPVSIRPAPRDRQLLLDEIG